MDHSYKFILYLVWMQLFQLLSFLNTFDNQTNKFDFVFSATDVLDLVSMKDAANCDKQYDMQISENHQLFERERYLSVLLKGMFSSALLIYATD